MNNEEKLIREIFGADTVKGCYTLAMEKKKDLENPDFQFPLGKEIDSKALKIVYSYMVTELKHSDEEIKDLEKRFNKLVEYHDPENALKNEALRLNDTRVKYKTYKELATWIYQMNSPCSKTDDVVVLQGTIDLVARRYHCYGCKYLMIGKDGECDTCLLGADPYGDICDGEYQVADKYKQSWVIRDGVAEELGKDHFSEEVMNETFDRINALNRENWHKEGSPKINKTTRKKTL